ncbi:MAG TPA: hypothetical protein VHB69_07355 [Mycobacteriales bacterium]|nr:hypothetical protein [Mycobacteriales bacterium]
MDELLAEMFDKKGPALVLGCYAKATDDSSLERLLLTAIHNFLIDQAKGTDRGKLRRRLETLLGADPRFTRADLAGSPGWALADGPCTAGTGDAAALMYAAFGVRDVSITRWNESGPTPKDTVHALVTIAAAVLTVAGGAVRDEDLARILQQRFALLTPPTVVSLSADESWTEPAAAEHERPDAAPATPAELESRSETVWQSLTPTERHLLPHLGETGPALAVITGTGPKQAKAIAAAVAEKVRLATVNDDERDETVLSLAERCRGES